MPLENDNNLPADVPADANLKEDADMDNVEHSPEPREEADMDAEMGEFDALINSYIDGIIQHEVESIIIVPVVEVQSDHVLVDMGDKAEGIIPLQEFMDSKGNVRVTPGEQIAVKVLGRDDETGLIQVSYRQARSHSAAKLLEQSWTSGAPVSGIVTRVVKSGLIVDVGIPCFMPASQIDDRRVENLEEWIGKEVDALVVDYNAQKGRAVLSRRRLIEDKKKKSLDEALGALSIGDTVEGVVRSVLNFGVFISLESLDVFLPRDEVSYDRGIAPSSVLKVGDTVQAKITQIDRTTGKVSVSRKALSPDPWDTAGERFPEGAVVNGEVVSITRFGAFVHIEEGLTGLIHVTDFSWAKGQQKVTDFVKEGDSVQTVVLAIDPAKRRLSLGLKQLVEDPWVEAEKKFPRNTKVRGFVTGLAPFGAFVKLTDDVEGLIHISDFSWDANIRNPSDMIKEGDEVEAIVLKTDRATRRISLGIKQLTQSPKETFFKDHPVGSVIEGEVVRMMPTGCFISLAPQIDGFLPVSQISTERVEKPEDVLKVGEKITCKISRVEKPTGKITVSRRAYLSEEEAEAMREYRAKPDKGVMKLGELLKDFKINKPE